MLALVAAAAAAAAAVIRARRRAAAAAGRRGGKGTDWTWVSLGEAEERRIPDREVAVLVLELALGRECNETETLSLVIMDSLGEVDCVMHGTDVHSSMGGRVVKFMQGASGPHRCGWHVSTCPAISGQSFSVVSFLERRVMLMGSSVATGGEVLRESVMDNAVRLLPSLIMLASRSLRELCSRDGSIDVRSESMLRS